MSLSTILTTLRPTSPSAVLTAHQTLAATLTSTAYQPYVYPYRAIGPHLFVAYLLLPPPEKPASSPSVTQRILSSPLYTAFLHYIRWPIFLVASTLCVQAILECRSPLVTIGYGIGIVNSWSVLWMATWMVFGEGRAARRIERIHDDERRKAGAEKAQDEQVDIKERLGKSNARAMNGDNGKEARRRGGGQDEQAQGPGGREFEEHEPPGFKWQGLPSTFFHRVDWVADLVVNFRGIRWSHQISGLPYPTSSSPSAFAAPITHQSSSITPTTPTAASSNSYPTQSAIIRSNLISFVLNLIFLDVLKYLMLRDPYFWGVPDPGPSPYPFPQVTRLVFSLAGVYSSLLSIFLLSPLVYCGVLGEKFMAQHAWPWLYPPYYGSPGEVWRKGLAGIWGGWWHQLFRLGFESAGEFVGRNIGWEKKTTKGGVSRVIVAFVCSGCLHLCGSYTALGDTRPRDALLFFALQPVGLIAQRAAAAWMKKRGIRDRIPASVRGACNLSLAVGWCLLTGPMIADDFAKGGIWLYEPMPFSLARGLAGQGWWCWGGTWARWHADEKWWKSGIAM